MEPDRKVMGVWAVFSFFYASRSKRSDMKLERKTTLVNAASALDMFVHSFSLTALSWSGFTCCTLTYNMYMVWVIWCYNIDIVVNQVTVCVSEIMWYVFFLMITNWLETADGTVNVFNLFSILKYSCIDYFLYSISKSIVIFLLVLNNLLLFIAVCF